MKASITVKMLVFDDGTVEGALDRATTLFKMRDRQAEVLQVWIGALNAASRASTKEARAILQRTLDSESERIAATPNYPGRAASNKISQLLALPDDMFVSQMADVKQRFERVHARQTRHRSGR